jgi:hypothetical protein
VLGVRWGGIDDLNLQIESESDELGADLSGSRRSGKLYSIGLLGLRVDEWGLLDWATCRKYRAVWSVRVVRSEDQFEQNNFGLQIFLPKILIVFLVSDSSVSVSVISVLVFGYRFFCPPLLGHRNVVFSLVATTHLQP